jgi:hypothetical protein
VLELHHRCPRARRPRGSGHRRPGRVGRPHGRPRLHAHPHPRRRHRRGGRAGRSVRRLPARHPPVPATAERSGAGLRGRRPRDDQHRHPALPLPGRGGGCGGPVLRPGRVGHQIRRHPGAAPRAPIGAGRGAGRLVGRGAAHCVRRAAHGPSRRHRRRVRHRGPTRDPRSRSQAAGRARHAGTDRRAHPGSMGVHAHLLQGAVDRRLQRLRGGGGRGRAPARHPSLSRSGPGQPDRPVRHAHPPVPPRPLARRLPGPVGPG